MTGRAYPIFDLAKLLLESRDRYEVKLKRENETSPDLFRCAADGSLWLSRDEAMRHVLNSKALEEYYEVEKIEGEAPKGNFTSVAICGMSGKLLGPPNYHGYQPALSRLYRERFSHMDFERFKSRIKMSQEEESIEKWKEQESTKTVYKPKGEEGVELKDFTALEQHFRQHHGETVSTVEEGTLPGNAGSRKLASGPLNGLIRSESDKQRRFPLDVMQFLCRKFEESGLKFFKKGKKRTFVTLSRPRPIPSDVSFSEGVTRIVDFVRLNPGTNLNQMAGMLLPKEERSRIEEPPRKKRKKKEPKGKAKEAEAEETAQENESEAKVEPAPAENPPPEAKEEAAATEEQTEAKAEPEASPEVAAETPEENQSAPAEETANEPVEAEKSSEPEAAPAESPAQEAKEESAATETAEEAPVAKEETPPTADAADAADAAEKEPEAPAPPALTDSEIAILQDLRWLVREGFVIEYNDGKLFLAPEREPRPPRKKSPKKKKAPDSSEEKKEEESKGEAKPDSSEAPKEEAASEPPVETAEEKPEAPAAPEPEAPAAETQSAAAEESPAEGKTENPESAPDADEGEKPEDPAPAAS